MILKRKFIGDISEEDMAIIERAALIDRRTKVGLIRKAAIDYARKIINEEEKKNEHILGSNPEACD